MSQKSLPLILLSVFSVTLSLCATSASGQSLDMLVPAAPLEERVAEPPGRLAERSALAADSRLGSAEVGAVDELVAMRRWNDEGRLPRRNGFLRPLSSPRTVDLGGVELRRAESAAYEGGMAAAETGALRWTTRVAVEESWRLRLRLRDVSLPEGVRMWVYSDDGETVGPFGLELRSPDGMLYTPSVAGPRLTLEVELPAGVDRSAARFELRELVQLFSPEDTVNLLVGLVPRDASCLKDANCVTTSDWDLIDQVQKSVGHIQFGGGFVCSGNLLNNTNEDLTPYFLTANHCFSNQQDASSVEVFWDYETPFCDGPEPTWPALSSLPQSNGSVLLATGASSDYTMVRLNGLAGNRVLLGWNANGVVNNQMLHRVSHPWPDGSGLPYPHVFSSYRVDEDVPICDGSPRSLFIHMKNVESATFGGSSGAATLNVDKAQVVGQLTGACGPDPNDGCNFENTEVDGDFQATFPNLQEWLAPGGGGIDYPACEPDATTLCIDDTSGDGRFQITMTYDSVLNGGFSGTSQAVALDSVGITKGGVLAFTNTANPEVLIKVLDACGPTGNEHFWVFYAATTTVGFTIEVIDTEADVKKIYTNPDLNAAEPVTDTSAFATCDV